MKLCRSRLSFEKTSKDKIIKDYDDKRLQGEMIKRKNSELIFLCFFLVSFVNILGYLVNCKVKAKKPQLQSPPFSYAQFSFL